MRRNPVQTMLLFALLLLSACGPSKKEIDDKKAADEKQKTIIEYKRKAKVQTLYLVELSTGVRNVRTVMADSSAERIKKLKGELSDEEIYQNLNEFWLGFWDKEAEGRALFRVLKQGVQNVIQKNLSNPPLECQKVHEELLKLFKVADALEDCFLTRQNLGPWMERSKDILAEMDSQKTQVLMVIGDLPIDPREKAETSVEPAKSDGTPGK